MKNAKRLLAVILSLCMVLVCFAACSKTEEKADETAAEETAAVEETAEGVEETEAGAEDVAVDYSGIKFGLICLHDENSTYDNNFIQALKDAQVELGLSDDQVLIRTNVPEDSSCYEAAAELAENGCNIIFADSFGHESYIMQAAAEFPEVQFCHATGVNSKTAGIDNFHNAFASIYEGRFLAGVAAGMKLNEMIEAGTITEEQAVIGYVGAFNYAEVVSGMTSFYLGARYICPSATMKVTYTNSWFDISLEREAAIKLIDSGCVLISQHADSEGAPKACEENNIPNIAYNIDTSAIGPNTAIISSKINWTPYFELAMTAVANGETFATDWCGTIETGSVELTAINEAVAAAGTAEKIDEVKAQFEAGTLKVYDCSTFTVNGENLTEYMADVDGDFAPDTNVIVTEGDITYFAESADEFRSAPFFDIMYIDGVSEL